MYMIYMLERILICDKIAIFIRQALDTEIGLIDKTSNVLEMYLKYAWGMS